MQATTPITTRARLTAWLRRPRNAVLSLLGTLLIALVIAAFHPRVQTELARRHLPPLLDQFSVERVHLLPWSLRVQQLELRKDGAHVALAEADIGFAPWKLLFDVFRVRRLHLDGLAVDVSEVPPASEPSAPFAGLFSLLNRPGYGLDLDDVDVRARVQLDADVNLRVGITGGGIASDATGALELDLSAERASDHSHADLAGALALTQDDADGFVALDADLLALASAPQLPEEEVVALRARAVPRWETHTLEDGSEARQLTGDAYDLIITKSDAHRELARVSATATYDASSTVLAGDYHLSAHDGIVTAYVADAVLPSFSENADGTFLVDLAHASVAADLHGKLELSALEMVLGDNRDLPDALVLAQTLSVYLEREQLEIHEFAAALSAPDGPPLLALELSEPRTLNLSAPQELLAGKHTLAALTLAALPVNWLNGLLPEPVVREGLIGAAFDVRADKGAVVLAATAPLAIKDVSFDPALEVGERLSVTTEPRVSLRSEGVTAQLKALAVTLGDSVLASIEASLKTPFGGEQPQASAVTVKGEIDLDGLARVPLVAKQLADYPLPAGLRAEIDTALEIAPERIGIRSLAAALSQGDRPALLKANALQPFSVALGGATPQLKNPEGELALVEIKDLDLAWINPFLDGLSIDGVLDGVTLALASGAGDALGLRARQPLRVHGLTVRAEDGVLVEKLSLRVNPEIDYTPAHTALRYSALDARVDGRKLLRGAGTLGVTPATDTPARISARGHLEVELQALHRIAALSDKLAALQPRRRWLLDADYDLQGTSTQFDIAKIDTSIAIDGTKYLHLRNRTALVVRTQVADSESLAQYLSGAIDADLEPLSSTLLGDLLPLEGIAFDGLSFQATLRSDGTELAADLGQGLLLEGVRLSGEDGPLLHPFSFATSGKLRAAGQTLDATLETLDLSFDPARQANAIEGDLRFTLQPGAEVPLRRMQAHLSGLLPVLLNQPILLPGNKLRTGVFALDAEVSETGAITAHAVLDQLQAATALAIERFEANASGALAADGQGFEFSMPLVGHGRSGETDGLLQASYQPAEGANAKLKLDFSSRRFLLNDVLAALASIRGAEPPSGSVPDGADVSTAPADIPTAPDITPDARAFWSALPYDTLLSYRIDNLYYTDYLIFTAVGGDITITPERFTLEALSADFHASPLRFDGALNFAAGNPRPYALKLDGSISEFDLNQFFSELIPGDKPRVEGLFNGKLKGYGNSPNMAQFRNELMFDLRLKSRAGLFRPLPPDSPLMIGASDVLGIVGEGLSYIPTGGFGAGALSRLVNFIAVIDYDRIDIRVVRDETRDIVIQRFLVQSPEISLTAHGGIDYADGKDILDSPLNLDANLNMSGKGAAILYSMDLLEDEQDKYGYYKGPAFIIRGTPAAAESNFAEIISAAADGTVKGAITRPISGLIGNIKHRWFGDTPDETGDEEPAPDDAVAPAP